MVIEAKKFLRFISIFMDISGITIWPFIIVRDERDKILINHERIHLKQQAEMLVIFFYIFYVFYWIKGYFKEGNGYRAYMSIPFEREAYSNEHDLTYTKERKIYSWRKYVFCDRGD